VVFLEDAPRLVRAWQRRNQSGVPKEEYDHYLIVTEPREGNEGRPFISRPPDDAYLLLLGTDERCAGLRMARSNDDAVRQIRELLK